MAKSNTKFHWKDFLFSFDGRISRKQYWVNGLLMVFVPVIIFSIGVDLALDYVYGDSIPVFLILSSVLIWPALALHVKRWHDRNKSGWWVLINLVPVAGIIWAIIEIGHLQGTVGPNQYGDDPLQ